MFASTDDVVFLALEPDRAEPYWDAARDEEFVLPYCDDCDDYFHPREAYCGACRTPVSYREPTQEPELVAATTVNPEEDAYTLVLVEVEDGVTLLTQVLEADIDELDTGAALDVTFAETADGYRLPCVTPSRDAAAGDGEGGWLESLQNRFKPL